MNWMATAKIFARNSKWLLPMTFRELRINLQDPKYRLDNLQEADRCWEKAFNANGLVTQKGFLKIQ